MAHSSSGQDTWFSSTKQEFDSPMRCKNLTTFGMKFNIKSMAKFKKLKTQDNTNKEIRHLGVIIERVDDKVGLVAEQYGDIKKILDVHTKKLDTHSEILGKLTVDVEIIKTDVEFIKHSLKRKVDIEEFAVLERRVALLEKRR